MELPSPPKRQRITYPKGEGEEEEVEERALALPSPEEQRALGLLRTEEWLPAFLQPQNPLFQAIGRQQRSARRLLADIYGDRPIRQSVEQFQQDISLPVVAAADVVNSQLMGVMSTLQGQERAFYETMIAPERATIEEQFRISPLARDPGLRTFIRRCLTEWENRTDDIRRRYSTGRTAIEQEALSNQDDLARCIRSFDRKTAELLERSVRLNQETRAQLQDANAEYRRCLNRLTELTPGERWLRSRGCANLVDPVTQQPLGATFTDIPPENIINKDSYCFDRNSLTAAMLRAIANAELTEREGFPLAVDSDTVIFTPNEVVRLLTRDRDTANLLELARFSARLLNEALATEPISAAEIRLIQDYLSPRYLELAQTINRAVAALARERNPEAQERQLISIQRDRRTLQQQIFNIFV